MFTINGYISKIGAYFIEVTVNINGSITWNTSNFYDNIYISIGSAGSFPIQYWQKTDISRCIELTGATYHSGSSGRDWFDNSGTVNVALQIKVPVALDGFSSVASGFNPTSLYAVFRFLPLTPNNQGVFYKNCSNVSETGYYPITNSPFTPLPLDTEAILSSNTDLEKRKQNAILIYNILRGEEAVHKWSITSIACICALMDCQSSFRTQSAVAGITPSFTTPWTNYGQLPALEYTYQITLNCPIYYRSGGYNDGTPYTRYNAVTGFPFFNRCYYINFSQLDIDGIYSDKIYTLEKTAEMWEYERKNNPQTDWCSIWVDNPITPFSLDDFSVTEIEPEEAVTIMYARLNRRGTTPFENQYVSGGIEYFPNYEEAIQADLNGGFWGLPCLIEKARFWYDFFKSIQPKKKHKMPLWEYLRYTV